MWEDPIVAEVRKVRQAHAAKFGYDLRRIVADINQRWEAAKATPPTKRSKSKRAAKALAKR